MGGTPRAVAVLRAAPIYSPVCNGGAWPEALGLKLPGTLKLNSGDALAQQSNSTPGQAVLCLTFPPLHPAQLSISQPHFNFLTVPSRLKSARGGESYFRASTNTEGSR